MASINAINNTIPNANFDVISGNINIGTAAPGNPYDLSLERSVAGLIGSSMQNTSNNAAAGVNMQLTVEPATADPFILFNINGANTWAAGADNSDSDSFKITTGSSPSAGTEVFKSTTAGAITFVNTATVTSGNVAISSGNLTLPTTTSAVGQIIQNGVVWIHSFGSDNLFIGTSAGDAGNFTLTGTDNIAIGANVMQSLTSGSLNFGIGTNTLNALTSGSNNVGYGIASLQGVTTTNQNTAIGNNSVRYTTGSNNVAVGYQAYQGAVGTTTGSNNIIIGTQSGSAYTAGESNNIVIGSTLAGTAAESNVIRIGNSITKTVIDGIRGITSASTDRYPVNIDVNGQLDGTGNLYLPSTTSAIGQILINNTRFINYYNGNTVIGSGSSNFTTTGTANVFVGDSIAASLGASANSNVAVGSAAMRDATTAAGNVAVGFDALLQVTTGNGFNTAVGYNALSAVTTGTNNIAIGASSGTGVTGANGSNIYLNNAGAAESNRLRIGSATGTGASQLNASFIHGIRGITTANADAIAVLIDSAGQLGTVSSSIRFKENVQDLPETRVLELRPVRFNYKQDGRFGTGLIAEEVEQVMPELVAYNQEGECESVKYQDLPVLLLAEIQKLRKELDELKGRING